MGDRGVQETEGQGSHAPGLERGALDLGWGGPEHRTDIPLTGCKNLYKKCGRQNKTNQLIKKMHFLGVGGQALKVIKKKKL